MPKRVLNLSQIVLGVAILATLWDVSLIGSLLREEALRRLAVASRAIEETNYSLALVQYRIVSSLPVAASLKDEARLFLSSLTNLKKEGRVLGSLVAADEQRSPQSQFEIASRLIKMGGYHEARDLLVRVTKNRRSFVPAYTALGATLIELGEYDRARKALNDALRLDRQRAETYLLLTDLNIVTHHFAQAIKTLDRAERFGAHKNALAVRREALVGQ